MGAYILKRLLLIIPTLLGIMIVNFTLTQFVPGGPIEQIIAQIEGQGDVFEGFAGSGDAGVSDLDSGMSEQYAGARGLPPDFIIRGLRTKRLLKETAATLVPGWVLRRRKRGLSVPIAAWINNGLRSEVDRLLDPARLRDQGVLPAIPIDELLSDHRAGRANHARALWPLVVLQYWLEHWIPGGETG